VAWSWEERAKAVQACEAALRAARRARRARAAGVAEALAAWRRALEGAWPPGFHSVTLAGLKRGDAAMVQPVVEFLEANPRFYRSGYAQETALKALRRVTLGAKLAERLRAVVLDAVDRRHGRGFRLYGALARDLDSPKLQAALAERLASAEPSVRRHARWVLDELDQAARERAARAR